MRSISTSAYKKMAMCFNTYWIPVLLIGILGVTASSCKKFLASYSQNNSFVEKSEDLDELLVGDGYAPFQSELPFFLYVMDDDTDLGKPEGIMTKNLIYASFHQWHSNPRVDSEGTVRNSDPYFTFLYNRIARINTILHNVPLLRDKGEPAAELDRISGEAHFLRAFYYFILVNAYGKPYHSATAATDFAVPLKTDPAVKDQFVTRNTVEEVYNQIIADLLAAEKELEVANLSSTIRANRFAAQALLSRTYLFMENYELALYYADEVIGGNNYQLADLNNHTQGMDFLKRNAPEVIFTMSSTNMPLIMAINQDAPEREHYLVSNDLLNSFQTEDLRLNAFFFETSSGLRKAAKKRETLNAGIDDVSDIYLIRLAEQYLNKAEALAAMDRFEEARNSLQELRNKRFKPADLVPVTSDGAELIASIREERRRELCFETHRWFDLRRYGVNTKYPFSKTIRHRSYAVSADGFTENGYYELLPYEQDKAAYVVPIANDEIEFNRGLLTNETRPVRPLKQ